MKKSIFTTALVTATFFNVAHASSADNVFEQCKENAKERLQTCESRNCEANFDRAWDRCYKQYEVNSSTGTTAYDANGQFTPIQIPQRQQYVLPGMQ